MATILREGDVSLLNGKVAVIGYGSQGHAHALNLHDSGIDVEVGLREGSESRALAEEAGLKAGTIPEAVSDAQLVAILLPDQVQPRVYAEEIGPNLADGAALLFAHGFNILYERVQPPEGHDVIMVAPKGPGHIVRRLYTQGQGTPALIAVQQDASGQAKALGLSYARGIGATRAAVLETTFKEETETDLFGEQTVLCGGITSLVLAGYDTLVDAGYQPESAYFECLHELKLIVDMMYEGGLGWMRHSISDTAEYGDYSRGPRIVTEQTRAEMKRILREIQSGQFAREWIAENRAGQESFKRMREEQSHHQIEREGRELRSMMDWIETDF